MSLWHKTTIIWQKFIIRNATEISQFVLGVNDVEVLENIDTEQQIVIGQRR